MRVPPWYRPRKHYAAEWLPTLDLSRATGIGPLEPGMSVRWDLTPVLGASDPSYRVRVEVDVDGKWLSVYHHNTRIIPVLRLCRDNRRIGAPLRAVCPGCDRLSYRLYLCCGVRCGKCQRVTYVSGQGSAHDRVVNRLQRLEYRLRCAEYLPRHRGAQKIRAEINRLDGLWFAGLPASLLRGLTAFQ